MSKSYYRKPEMFSGGPFRCYNCDKLLAANLTGSVFELHLKCPRCKAEIRIKCGEPIPFVSNQTEQDKKLEEVVNGS